MLKKSKDWSIGRQNTRTFASVWGRYFSDQPLLLRSRLLTMRHVSFFLPLTLVLLTCACAHVGSPGGGPRDVQPPKLIKSEPRENQTYYSKNKIQLFFDELVSVDGGMQKVIISPPQLTPPQIKAVGDRIVVEFADSLKDSTTYTVDFTDAIVDYNEKNKFGDYAFSFSTGGTIDSLRISGTLIDASNLNPISGVLVGAHEVLDDTAFTSIPLMRISRTNENGFFSIKGLPDKTFRVYALGDKNRDYRFDQHGESIAFLEDVFDPWVEECVKMDTVWKDTATIDTVYRRLVPCYKPDDLVLSYFAEDYGRQYLSKRERPSREQFTLLFGRKSESLPVIQLLNAPHNKWYVTETNLTKDTIHYWITDSSIIKLDTLVLQLDYLKTDSTDQLVPQTDTLKLLFRQQRPKNQPTNRKNTKDNLTLPEPVRHLTIQMSIPDVVDMNARIPITVETPLSEMPNDAWHLYKKVDSTWHTVPFRIHSDSLFIRQYYLSASWEYGEEYKLSLDSGRVKSIYGFTNDDSKTQFRVRKEEEYSRLILTVTGIEGLAFVELLDRLDNVVRRELLADNKVDFKYLRPGTYYMRAIADNNGNGRWDTGDFAKRRQPETVYYRPESVRLRANWEEEDLWYVKHVSLLNQKPKALRSGSEKKGGR